VSPPKGLEKTGKNGEEEILSGEILSGEKPEDWNPLLGNVFALSGTKNLRQVFGGRGGTEVGFQKGEKGCFGVCRGF